jgi:hypothetical protein
MIGEIGRILVVLGAILLLLGILLVVLGRIPGVGRLPGDLVVQRGNWTFYFPLATSLIVSLLLTLLFWVIGRR